MKNKIIQGDNLEIMRSLPSESVDLIATDPPYNSNGNYKNKKTEEVEFTDKWCWDEEAVSSRLEMEELAFKNEDYSKALNTLTAFDIILCNADRGKKGQTRSYLTFMAAQSTWYGTREQAKMDFDHEELRNLASNLDNQWIICYKKHPIR